MKFKTEGSIPPAGACIGSILAAFTLRSVGRKYTIVMASPVATIAWMLIATATRYEVIIAARFLTGFCAGFCLPAAQVYVCNYYFVSLVTFFGKLKLLFQIGESVDPKIRGILGSMPSIFMSLAILISYVLGSLVKWDTLAWFCSLMTGMCFIAIFVSVRSIY